MNRYEYVKECVRKRVEWCKTLKDRPCCDCGVKYPSFVMDWHHKDPADKVERVAKMVYLSSRKKIVAEISKCVLLCSNCHRIRHWKEEDNTPL